ncbi:MAG: universal stress protein [Hymenobacter sp.]
MKNLLVPTDFSPEAHHAYEVALQLAKHTNGTVTLLHVLDTDTTGGGFSTMGTLSGTDSIDEIFTLKLLEVTKRRLHALTNEAPPLASGVPVHDSVEMERTGDGILAAIKRHNIDMVVMGARGHGAMEHFFVSSTTERMIRLAPCPVLTVKHQQVPFEVHNIVFPSDFSAEAVGALGHLRHIQEVFPGAKLHLLHVVGGQEGQPAQEQQMHAFAQQHKLLNYQTAVVGADRTSSGIEQYARHVHADLVVMPTHTRSGLSRFLHTSIAETVATHTFPPVLTYHFQ